MRSRRWSVWLLVGVLVALNPLWGASSRGRPLPSQALPETITVEGKKAYIVIFREPPLARYEGGIRGLAATSLRVAPQNRREGKLSLESPASANYLSYLEARQNVFVQRLRQRVPEAQWAYAYRIVLNGLAALIPEDHVEEVARWPEVARLLIVKKDGRRQEFDREKLKASIKKACAKRPISAETIERVVDQIEATLRSRDVLEVPSSVLGDLVMEKLKGLDQVAYIRFASVYRAFADLSSFEAELARLLKT